MICIDKFQKVLGEFLGAKEIPPLESLLREKGYNFIQKDKEIIPIEEFFKRVKEKENAQKVESSEPPKLHPISDQEAKELADTLQAKIEEAKQQIAQSKNKDKEYLHQVFKPDEIIQLEKRYFNQAIPKEYKEMIQDFPRLYEQSLADNLKIYKKDTDAIKETTTQLLNDFKDKPFKDTAKHAQLLLFNTLRDKAKQLGFKELDINAPSFKVAFSKLQAKLKKGDIQDLSEHIATNKLQHNRLRIQETLNIHPTKEFGENYAEFYRDGKGGIQKLITEAQAFKESGQQGEFSGQVAGAFYREELGDIDLVWGDKNIGLQKIVDKHLNDFADFVGNNPYEKMANAISEIIQNGKLITENGVNTLWYKNGNDYYLVGISQGFNKKGDNNWIITSYKKTKGKIPDEIKGDTANLSAYSDEFNPLLTSKDEPLNSSDIIPQETLDSTKAQSNPHLGSGLVGGSVSGIEEDENGNLTFNPEKFALGFLGGAVGSKAVAKGFTYLKENPQLKEAVARELANTLAQGFDKAKAKYPLLSTLEPRYIIQNEKGRVVQAKAMLSELEKKEQKGIYNVAYNGKNAVLIQKDLEAIESAILLQKGTKRKGGKHIRLAHSIDKTQQGYVTKNEVVNLGKDIRQFLKEHKEPFIDTNGARLYEWEKDSARFRVVVNDIQDSGGNSLLPSASEEIITFYSDRNLKEKMEFKNPALNTQKITDNAKMQQGNKVDIETNLQNGLIYNTQETRHIGNLRADLKQALSPYLNKEIVNKATGITAQISTTGLNKIASKKAVDKSVANGFSRDEHFKVAGDLKNLFENATKKESYADKKQSKDVVSIHRFFTEITINDKQAQAKMTLKESIDYGNRIYSLELEELIPSP